MANEDIPILVVDDAKFSSAIIAKALRGGGFQNVRFTNNPLQALRSLEKRPAQILIADWMMPNMDGLELSRRVKKLDESLQHFTYIMLLTARDDIEAYAAYRVGYHRGLDRLRQNGWRGSGYVRWAHEENRGFLRALAGLQRSAAAIGETDEDERCLHFLRQCDPQWSDSWL